MIHPTATGVPSMLDTLRALGRLLGVVAVSTEGLIFPVDLSLSVYKALRGHRVDMTDLSTLRRQLYSELETVCAMEEKSLKECNLSFTGVGNGKGGGGGGARDRGQSEEREPLRVNKRNRMDFLRRALQTSLCCEGTTTSSSMWSALVTGWQEACPRGVCEGISPEVLQMKVQGGDMIDTQVWREHTHTPCLSETDTEVVSFFWSVIQDFTTLQRMKILCRALGTATLPDGGWAVLVPKFTVVVCSQLTEGNVPRWLPHLHTVILPQCVNKEALRVALLTDLSSDDGDL